MEGDEGFDEGYEDVLLVGDPVGLLVGLTEGDVGVLDGVKDGEVGRCDGEREGEVG